MCGLTFLYHPQLDHTTLQSRIIKAQRRLIHRGPDDDGVWCAPSVAMGHRRLAILDIADSRQPMHDPSSRHVLVYNGEIYNFRDLRQTLSAHWHFRTRGDTEVVLAGLVRYGEAFLSQMEGMWALALWDNHKRTILLSRDRLGQKPLFYED